MMRDMRKPVRAGDEATFAAFLDENLAEGHLDPKRLAHIDCGFVVYVAEQGTVGMMRAVLERGFPVNAPLCQGNWDFQNGYTGDQATPLFDAAFRGRSDMVRFLLSAGAEVNARDASGATPLMAAAWSHQDVAEADTMETVRVLLDNGADVNAVAENGDTALTWATEMEHEGVQRLLREAGANQPRATA